MTATEFYKVVCDHCAHTGKIGDARSAKDILKLLESGDAPSGHAFGCPATTGHARMSFTLTNEKTGEVTTNGQTELLG